MSENQNKEKISEYELDQVLQFAQNLYPEETYSSISFSVTHNSSPSGEIITNSLMGIPINIMLS